MRKKFDPKNAGGVRRLLADGVAVETFAPVLYGLFQFSTTRDPEKAWTATKRFAVYIGRTHGRSSQSRSCQSPPG